MNAQQTKRYQKLFTEAFYLLERKKEDKYEFTVSGSTKNVYQVTIDKKGKVFCSCPDAKSWAAKCHCVCKHCLFVLYRVLKIFDTTGVDFFTSLTLNADELDCIEMSFVILDAHIDADVLNDELSERFRSLSIGGNKSAFEEKRAFTEDDLCGICYLTLADNTEEEYVSCPTCKKTIHKVCMDKWIDAGNKICVYCRSEVWKNFKKTRSGKYQNLA